MADRRKLKTKRAIVGAFISLLKEKDINKITVSEICGAAELGRGTFYLHYQDVFDLYAKIENEILGQLFNWTNELFSGKGEAEDFALFLEKVAYYLLENREMAELFLNDRGSLGFLRKIKDFLIAKRPELFGGEGSPMYHDLYQLEYEVSGIVGIFQYWIGSNMTKPPREIAKIIMSLHGFPIYPCPPPQGLALPH